MRFHLERVRLNKGGYDTDGSYWGTGLPLYYYTCEERCLYKYIRAYDREDAKRIIMKEYPSARFFK